MIKIPHPHQHEAIRLLRESLSSGKRRPIIQAPTGFGKTLLAAMIVEGALAKGNRVIFVVPALSLIDQTVQAFYEEGITEVGVIQANHHMTDYSKPVQVASVQTLMKRDIPKAAVVVIDEVHRDYTFLKAWMAQPEWEKVIFIGLSATPWTKGLGKHWDDLIIAETTQGLIAKGFLSPFRVFASAHPDLRGVKTVAGDYHEGQLAEVMGGKSLVAGVVETWLAKGENRPTFCFAVDCAHAQKLQLEFEAAGVACGYMDAYTERADRNHMKAAFEHGDIKVICNVGVLTTGIDWDVRCLIMARPTKSEILYVQMIGRGLRTASGKTDCTIFDHADNAIRLGFVTDIHHTELNTGKKENGVEQKKAKPKLPKECPSCTFMKPVGVHKCPNCGFEPVKVSNVQTIDGELVEYTGGKQRMKKREYTHAEKQLWYSGFLYIEKEKGYKPGWAAWQYKSKLKVWPRGLSEIAGFPTVEVSNYVRSRQIAYAKSKRVS
jgi:DNA repair protein RadD